MPQQRRKTFDDTPEGQRAHSTVRNRGADRMIEIVQNYAESSGHKVLINLIPTWPGKTKPRVWLSHPANEIIPLKVDATGKLVPFYEEVDATENHVEDPREDQETPPGSQRMGTRSAAIPGTKETKKDMKQRCGHCCTGRNLNDLHPNSAWIKCGEPGCRSVNHSFHAICHGIRVRKMDEKSFNKKYVRCLEHLTEKKKQEGEEEVSDEDFETTKKKKPGQKRKAGPSKVFTPGTKNLPPLKKASHTEDQEQLESHTVKTSSLAGHGDEEEIQLVSPHVKTPSLADIHDSPLSRNNSISEDESDKDIIASPPLVTDTMTEVQDDEGGDGAGSDSSEGSLIFKSKKRSKSAYVQNREEGEGGGVSSHRSISPIAKSKIQPKPTYATSKNKVVPMFNSPESDKSVVGESSQATFKAKELQMLPVKPGRKSKLSRPRPK